MAEAVKNSRSLVATVGDPFVIREGCERKYNGQFVDYSRNFSRADSSPVESLVDAPQMRDYSFVPRSVGEFSFRYEVNPLSAMGDAIRVTIYNVNVTE